MARDFNGSTQYLSRTSAVVSSMPFTVAGWFQVDGTSAAYDLFSLGNSANNTHVVVLRADGGIGGDPLRAIIGDGTYGIADSTVGFTASGWHHAAGVFTSVTSRTVYLNGGNSSTNATDITGHTPTLDRTALGVFLGSSTANFVDGRLAEWGIWNAALSAGEIASLAAGISPLLIRRQNLVAYWPILGAKSPETDRWRSSFPLTLTGSPTQFEHPPIIQPPGSLLYPPPAAARTVGTHTVGVTIAGIPREINTRIRGLSITDVLDEQPNSAMFRCDGFAPQQGHEVRITYGSSVLFAGHILSVRQVTEARNRANVAYDVDCLDYTWILDRRLVNRQYGSQSASDTVHDLIANYAPGFTGANVVAGLPTIDAIEFTDENLSTAMTRTMKRVGGYWYVDENKDIHAFLTESTDAPDDLSDVSLAFNDLNYEIDLSQIRTRVFVEGGGSNARAEVAVGASEIPVEDAVTWQRMTGGLVKAGSQRIAYSGITVGGSGALVGTTVTPTNAPTLAPSAGSGLSNGTYLYAVTFATGSGETLPGPTGSIVVSTAELIPSTNSAGVTDHNFGGGLGSATYAWKYTWRNSTTGAETRPSPSAGTTLSSGIHSAKLERNGIQAAPSGWFRRWYRTQAGGATLYWMKFNDSEGGFVTDSTYHYDFAGDVGNLDLTVQPPSVALVNAQVALSSIPVGPSGTTSRKIYRTVANGAQLKLVTTIADNTTTTYTDSTADGSLGANAPISDTSGLVAQTGEVSQGSASLLVTSVAPFESSGGWAFIGSLPVRYTGKSSTALTGIPASGVGALTTNVRYGVEVIASPMLTGIPTSGIGSVLYTIPVGTPVNVLAQRDNEPAQAALAALEGGDGIHEHVVKDNRLAIDTAEARGDAELAMFKDPIVKLTYTTRDPKTRSGKTITVNLGAPTNIAGTFKILRVTRTEIGVADNTYPLCAVEASSIKFSLEDLLRRVLLQVA